MGKYPGSGIQIGYEYYGPMPQHHRDSKSESLMDRDVYWSDKISQYYKDNPGKATERMHKSWKDTRHHLYELVDPYGEVHYTENLSEFCKGHGLLNAKMCDVAKGRLKHYKKWTCKYVYRYDGKLKQRVYMYEDKQQ